MLLAITLVPAAAGRWLRVAVIDAVTDAIRVRLRPIMMSMVTTVAGLSPLLFNPGAGTELYRGLGAIVLLGLLFSTLVTLTFMPAMLALVLRVSAGRRREEEGAAVGEDAGCAIAHRHLLARTAESALAPTLHGLRKYSAPPGKGGSVQPPRGGTAALVPPTVEHLHSFWSVGARRELGRRCLYLRLSYIFSRKRIYTRSSTCAKSQGYS